MKIVKVITLLTLASASQLASGFGAKTTAKPAAVAATPIYQGGILDDVKRTDLCVNFVGKPSKASWFGVPQETKTAFAKICCSNSAFQTNANTRSIAKDTLSCSSVSATKKPVPAKDVEVACQLLGRRGAGWKGKNKQFMAAANALCCPLQSFNNKNSLSYPAALALGCRADQVIKSGRGGTVTTTRPAPSTAQRNAPAAIAQRAQQKARAETAHRRKLTTAHIEALKNTPEALRKRADRAAKRAAADLAKGNQAAYQADVAEEFTEDVAADEEEAGYAPDTTEETYEEAEAVEYVPETEDFYEE